MRKRDFHSLVTICAKEPLVNGAALAVAEEIATWTLLFDLRLPQGSRRREIRTF